MPRLWDAALNLLYPPSCCGCARPTDRPDFCHPCRTAIRPPGSPLCLICGTPFFTAGDADHACGRCLAHAPHFRRARACAIYDAAENAAHPLKSVLQRYKYNRDIGLVYPLARIMIDHCPLAFRDYDVIVPVPLHLTRLRWRGFNQAQFLARQLARTAALPVEADAVRRIRPTRPQVQLNEAERRQNVAGAFRVVRPERVRAKRVLLVDDVYTTGATVDECSRALRRAGAQSIDVLVLARAVLH